VDTRKEIAEKFKVSYSKVYKFEWDFRKTSKLFSEVVHGYPDDAAMNKVLDKFRAWGRAEKHMKTLQIFSVRKVARD
jgi:hypothetical protein